MDLFDNDSLIADRKRWNRTIAQFDDDVPKCGRCNGPLETIADPVIGVELVCKNPDCETYN